MPRTDGRRLENRRAADLPVDVRSLRGPAIVPDGEACLSTTGGLRVTRLHGYHRCHLGCGDVAPSWASSEACGPVGHPDVACSSASRLVAWEGRSQPENPWDMQVRRACLRPHSYAYRSAQ